ncbi:WecB/TagA/CpsF family glycosyltransferase [Paraburkholderia sp. C35]|uniref:WecB/TagA/CpsF family glycosyltransferase n=1 Tax=Paraburkholderia sp. C35 TaxID=2126993 RepID=UPI0013A57E8D|nr:WecB/TagA/CpsF family glycosyltransferase [Paraburkholderia sp. C35]
MRDQFIEKTIGLLRSTTVINWEASIHDTVASLREQAQRPLVVSWVNAHAVMLAKSDRQFFDALSSSDLILRDGIGVAVMLRMMGVDPGANMNGTDLIPENIRAFEGKAVALFGTVEPYLSRAADAVRQMGGRVVATLDGFESPQAYVDRLDGIHVDLVVLGMGMPRQEHVASFLSTSLKEECVILNGGAILDFMGRRFPRAPQVWRNLRIEWLFRLMLEPRRLWRRYLLGGVRFAAYSVRVAVAVRTVRGLVALK